MPGAKEPYLKSRQISRTPLAFAISPVPICTIFVIHDLYTWLEENVHRANRRNQMLDQ